MAVPSFYNQGDQELYKQYQYLPQEKYRLGLNLPKTEQDVSAINTSFGIPATNAFTNSGSNSYYSGSPNNLITDYNQITKDRYFRNQDTPLVDDLYQSRLDKTFLGFPSYRQQELTGTDMGEYIGSNTDIPLEKTMAGRIQSGIGSFQDKIGNFMGNVKGFGPVSMVLGAMDQFDTLSPVDQQFINMNMGYTGPTVFGENQSGLSKDPFGINTRSAFGNYADYVEGFNTDYTDEEFEKLSNFQKQKVNFYRAKQKELNEIKQKEITEQKQQAQDFVDKNPTYGDPEKNINPGSGGGQGYDPQHDYSGSTTRDKHDRSSDLGFSDIRLKENVELIGKSPSNINIYKFNYKNNPTTYQGAMAHEVPWASVKNFNGYMMIDYNKIDVEFKKI
jgi:hypothetical protein